MTPEVINHQLVTVMGRIDQLQALAGLLVLLLVMEMEMVNIHDVHGVYDGGAWALLQIYVCHRGYDRDDHVSCHRHDHAMIIFFLMA